MKVLGLVHQYIPDRSAGAETHIHAMFRALAERGHDVDVVLSRMEGAPYVVDGVRVWPMVDVKADPFRWIPGADIVVAHLENSTRASVLGHFNGIPVCNVHHNDFEQTRSVLTLDSARTDLVVTNSHWMTESLNDWAAERLIQLPPRVMVRPGVEVAEYEVDRAGADRVTLVNLRRADGADNGLSKGGETLRALALAMPKTKFLGVTGAYGVQQELDDLPNVEVIDHVPHDRMVAEVYARTRILLVPSNYESWGRVAAEAMASGIPVIASPTPGLMECLGDAGTFVDPADTQGWVEAINGLRTSARYRAAQVRSADRARELEADALADLDHFVSSVEACVISGGFQPLPLEAYSA